MDPATGRQPAKPRRTRRPAGRRARRPAAPPQRHRHPDRQGSCDHANAENRYTPSRKLGHLVRARTATCPAPGCGAHAYHNDLDHTVPHPDGPTDECNIAPPCRRHHRVKQAPGWKLEQPEPGVMIWTTPSGRTYTTKPTVYEM
jgi:hypothetical protein